MSIELKELLKLAKEPQLSKWELDNVVWNERSSNPAVLIQFLERIDTLQKSKKNTPAEDKELEILEELAEEMSQEECKELLSQEDDLVKNRFIETLARKGALETLCNDAISMDTMVQMCKLSPSDFILAAKRSQDLINSIRELVIQGETLSSDVGGA